MDWISEWHYLVPIAICVFVLNIAAIIITLRIKSEQRKSTTVLMISLLVSDAIFGAVTLPVRMVEIWLAKSMVFPYVYAYVIFVSAFNSFCLSLDRYTSVVKPLWRRRVSNGTVNKGLAFTWITPGILSLLPLSWSYTVGYNSTVTVVFVYFLVGILIFIIACVVVLQCLVMYGLFKYWAAAKRDAGLRRSTRGRDFKAEFKQKLNSSLLCTFLILSTIVTWVPTIVHNFIDIPSLSKISLFALMVNSALDPLLIVAFKSKCFASMCRAYFTCCTRVVGCSSKKKSLTVEVTTAQTQTTKL